MFAYIPRPAKYTGSAKTVGPKNYFEKKEARFSDVAAQILKLALAYFLFGVGHIVRIQANYAVTRLLCLGWSY